MFNSTSFVNKIVFIATSHIKAILSEIFRSWVNIVLCVIVQYAIQNERTFIISTLKHV